MDEEERNHFTSCPVWSAVGPSYEWPRNTLKDQIKYVTHGRFEDLPQSTSKTVRIFLSSTFTDTYTERNLLMKNVYPKLQKLCKEKYDLDFQVVDMRWGIRNEASVDHSASYLCMKEIETCKNVSVGPTFVALLSHRYGGRHLPAQISTDEMDIIASKIKSTDDLALVKKWYKLDENSIPSKYILQPIVNHGKMEEFLQGPGKIKGNGIHDIAVDYLGDDDYEANRPIESNKDRVQKKFEYADLVSHGKQVWSTDESHLLNTIRDAVKEAMKDGRISEENGHKFFYSITEEEIRQGLVKEPKSKDRCLVFVRELENVNMKHEKAWRFVETTDDHEINTETESLLTKMKTELIPSHLPSDNIYNFKTQWSDNEGINEEDHRDYLNLFCDTFEKAILDLIERGYNNTSVEAVGKIYPEVLEHSHQAVQKVERFHGRESLLENIKTYLMSTSDQPLIIHGESGCGKTSVLAKAALQVPNWLGDNDKSFVILRFLGTTPDSSTVYKTLASISQQIITLVGLEKSFPELPQEFSDLKDMFRDVLNAVSSEHRVVIFLDSLDQLSATNNAHKLLWFPTKLPQCVKLIASTLPKEHGILDKLKSQQMQLDKNQFVPVKDLETNTSHEIIDLWLSKINRKLCEPQKIIVDELISHDVRPLYLKLVFDEISNWKSFEEPIFHCQTIPSCLQRLYRKIETKHGEMLVSKALGYLSASKNGLTQIEIEDILSLDDEVLNDVFEFHTPPIRRLPSILWARIRSDLTEYIVDRDADGAKVMAWYHRQFIQEAHNRYLPGSSAFGSSRGTEESLPLYKTLADYFAGIWGGGKAKPFKYTEKQKEKLKLPSAKAAENRYVPEQPVVFRSQNGSIDIRNIRYNLRKLSELPPACSTILIHEDYIPYTAEHICLNPEFLAAWIKNAPWEEISEFMNENSRESSYGADSKEMTKAFKKNQRLKEENENNLDIEEFDWEQITKGTAGLILQMSTIQQCLLLSYISVLNNPTYLGPDVTARLLMFYGIMDGISNWVRHTDTEGRKMCALIPPHMQLETAGSELMFIINNHIGPIQDSQWASHDENLCISASEKLVLVSLEAGQILIDTRPRSMPKGDSFNKIFSTSINSEGLYFISLRENPLIYVFDNEGEVLTILDIAANLPEQKSFKITGMTSTRNSDKISLHLFDSSKNVILSIINVLEADRIYKELLKTDSNVLELFAQQTSKYGNQDTDRLMIVDGKGVCYLAGIVPSGDVQMLDKKSFSFPTITASCSVYKENGFAILLGFETGNICVLQIANKSHVLKNMSPNYLFNPKKTSVKPKYGIPHYVHHSTGGGDTLGIVCTNTHLIAFGGPFQLGGMASTDDDSNSDEDTPQKSSTMKMFCRIRKRYNMAIYTPKMVFLIAARGGSLDIFKIDNVDASDTQHRLQIQFFTTIDAHGQDVTNILPTDEDILFMTSSLDSSLKFYMLARAGNIRKYVPNFDRAEKDISTIIPGKEFAITFAESSRLIHQWEIANGRIRKIFEHPKNLAFLKCAVDDAMHNILAIDCNGSAFLWHIVKRQSTTLRRSMLKKKTTTGNLVPTNAAMNIAAEAPDPDMTITTGIQLPVDISEGNIHMFMFSNTITFLATAKSEDAFLLDPKNESNQLELIKDVKGPFQHALKLGGERVMLIHDNTFILYNVMLRKVDVQGTNIIDISDIKYMPDIDKMIASSKDQIVAWTPGKEDSTKLTMDKTGNEAKFWKFIPCSESLCLLVEPGAYEYALFNVSKNKVLQHQNIIENKEKIKWHTCTPDGKYLIYVVRDKHVHLVRISDDKLLAWYTMYDEVKSITTSPDSWYVLIATSDRRLFVLLIADPDDRSHDKRIEYVRSVNPPLTKEQAMSLLGDANEFDMDSDQDSDDYFDSSDDEYLIAKAEKRLQQRAASALGKQVKVLYSSDSSEEEEDFGKKHHRSKSRMKKEELKEGPHEPAYEGELISSTPCTLQ